MMCCFFLLLLLFAGKDRLCNCNMEMMGCLELAMRGQITNGCGFELLLLLLLLRTWLTDLHPRHSEEGQRR